ncbi:interference hedgehog [Musca vetustissima]|uniref:interference hedgehog n=1 Tax=Musca vetustissima TaxID=27455 RepID=UPI002AB73A13|nr:interference hedgehog [Musca vetustissima]
MQRLMPTSDAASVSTTSSSDSSSCPRRHSPSSQSSCISSATTSPISVIVKSVIFLVVFVSTLCHAQLGVHVVRSPESAVAPKGDEVVFECEMNLTPDRFKWKFRHSSNRTADGSGYRDLTQENGYNITHQDRISKLRIVVQTDSLGDYQCVASYGSAAIASLPARLTLVSISIDNSNGYTRNTIRYNVAPKNCILLRCGTVTSNPAAIWSFFRNGEKIPQSDLIPANGALVLNTVSTKDSGNYSCSAMNPITSQEVKLPQRIELLVSYSDRTAPHFLKEPPNQVTARPGDTVVLECPGVGSPAPIAVWSSPNIVNINNNNRTRIVPYGLQIVDVVPEDQGPYVCRLDNGIAPALVHLIKLTVLEKPSILRGPASTLTNESDTLELECSAAGYPYPDIYWLINGQDTSMDPEVQHDGRRLVIQHVQKRHAGIVQCFAKNEVGETSDANLLKVNPKQIHGSSGSAGAATPRPRYEEVSGGGGGGSKKGSRKKHKPTMVPPSRPNVTRLSDDSVMLRWNVPRNDGLPIQFFKVQYRMLGDITRKIPKENWQTTNDDIPYGRRNGDGPKNYTTSVTGLKPDRFYRFRIVAVYNNDDNKEGNTSSKFLLQRGDALDLAKSNLPIPELARIEPLSESAVLLQWTLPNNQHGSHIDGFYAYYRPSSSAGEYQKATVDGMHTRKFKIDMLEAGTAYEFKLQSFNDVAASEFSSIVSVQTKKSVTTPAPTLPAVVPATKTNDEDNSIFPVVAGAAGGGILLLIATITACLCVKRRKNSQSEDENKPQLDHIQSDFVSPQVQVLGVNNHHKGNHRLNGVLPRMNITPNPLAQEADKNRNVMELRFMTNNTTNTTGSSSNNSGSNSSSHSTPNHSKSNSNSSHHTNQQNSCHNSQEKLNSYAIEEDRPPHTPPQRSTSSCETLEAVDGINCPLTATANGLDPNSPLCKPLPPLPGKNAAKLANHTTTTKTNHKSTSNNNLNNSSQASHLASQGIHHAQPYYQTPPTPTMMAKRGDYQQPPPVPPHQNNNHAALMNHHLPPTTHHGHAPLTPSMEQHRRTLDRGGVRNMSYSQNNSNPQLAACHDPSAVNMDNMTAATTRIPSLRRTRRTSGGSTNTTNGLNSLSNNPNGGLGIPITVSGSPRVQRSPMPARAAMMKQRSRLGSHNDNISSGSLNSIEV